MISSHNSFVSNCFSSSSVISIEYAGLPPYGKWEGMNLAGICFAKSKRIYFVSLVEKPRNKDLELVSFSYLESRKSILL